MTSQYVRLFGKSIKSLRLARFVFIGSLMACSFATVAGKSQKTNGSDHWDVNVTQGEDFTSVSIKTQETTWSNLAVSGDGKTLLFDMLGDIYTVPLSGGKATPLMNSMAWDYQPVFSPDGRQIAFISDRDGADNLWLMDSDGKNPRQLSFETANMVHNPAYSPDGNSIAVRKGFVSSRSIAAGEIWIYNVRGGNGVLVREKLHGKGSQKNIAEPSFSADGQYVYYAVDNTPGKRWEYNKNSVDEIFVINRWNLQTGEEETIVSGPGGAIRPTPSPSGKYLAFVKRVGFESAIFLKELASGVESQLFLGLDRDMQEADGSQGNTPRFTFTPDEESIVFWAKGKFHKISIASKVVTPIPVDISIEKTIAKAVRHNVVVAPDSFEVKMPRWAQYSPDGEAIYFQAIGFLYSKDLKTNEIKRLTSQNHHFEQFPALSRDGKKLVYTTWHDTDLGDVRVLDLTNGASTTITLAPGHYIEPEFSPDGQAVVYRKIGGGYLLDRAYSQEPGLYYAVIGGSAPQKLRISGYKPHFGAKADRLFFLDYDHENDEAHLVSSTLDGLDKRIHFKGNDVTDFRVSPDGGSVAFREQFKFFLSPFVMTGLTQILNSAADQTKISPLSNHAGDYLNWSADSKFVTWVQGPKVFRQDVAKVLEIEERDAQKKRDELVNDSTKSKKATPKDKDKDETPKGKLPESFIDLKMTINLAKPEQSIALVGATVVTMRNADKEQEVLSDAVVITKNDRILQVGPRKDVTIPVDAKVIDVAGATIIPGFIDVHAHGGQGREEIIPQQNWMNYSSLSFGVTTIHDPSNNTSEIFAAAELQKSGKIVAPRIFSTGTILYGAYATGATAKIKDYEQAKYHVERMKDVGAISVKSYQQLQRSSRQMVVKAGRELQILVFPEGGSRFQYNMGMIADGHTGIEHALPVHNAYNDVVQFWSGSNTFYTPTSVVAYGGLAGETYWYDTTDVWKNPRLRRFVPDFVVEPVAVRRQKAPIEHYNHFGVAKLAKKLRDAGVKVQLGAHGQREGLAAHWELWMLTQGGFSNWEALRSASWDGAHYLGMERDLGSLEAGKLADLVVINGDPLNDIYLSEMVRYTMIGGKIYDATTMNELNDKTPPRQPFYFERQQATGMSPDAQRYWQQKAERLHWVH